MPEKAASVRYDTEAKYEQEFQDNLKLCKHEFNIQFNNNNNSTEHICCVAAPG